VFIKLLHYLLCFSLSFKNVIAKAVCEMSANDDGTFSERSENKGPVLFYFIFSLCFLSRFVFMKSSDREESCSSPETLRNLSLQILKPSEKKAKYQYGGLNSGRPITPPRNNLVKAK